jgi:hypothetical protein
MFTNYAKVIANKVIHQNPRGTLIASRFIRQNPLDFSETEETTSTILMKNYRYQRMDETLQYCSKLVNDTVPNSKFGSLLVKYKKEIPEHFRDQVMSMIKFDQINPSRLSIEPMTNILYMASKFETRNEELENALIIRLKEKSIEDATISNLADLLCYFNSSQKIAESHKDFVNKVAERAKEIVKSGILTVQYNGSNIGLYEANAHRAYSTLEQGVIQFVNAKGSNDLSLSIRYGFLMPLGNFFLNLISKKLNNNAWLFEASHFNELQRLVAFLEDFK